MTNRRNKVTMIDVARESGVSLSTVSLALNGKPGLPPETRLKVQSMASQLGYKIRIPIQPKVKPCLLQTVGVLVTRAPRDSAPPSSTIPFSHVFAGIEAGCRHENISLLYSTMPFDSSDNILEISKLVHDKHIDALLLVGSYIDETLYSVLRQRNIPIVLVEAYSGNGRYDSIVIDNKEGAYNAVKYLIDLGHRHIAFIGSQPDSRISFLNRRKGYIQALHDHGVSQSYFGDCPTNNREDIITTTRSLLAQNPQISAVFGCSDEVSIIAMHGIFINGKKVPEDISVVSFDNSATAENAIPPLTTIHVDKYGMGRLAVQLLINRAENPKQGFVTMQMHTRLIERQSVRKLV